MIDSEKLNQQLVEANAQGADNRFDAPLIDYFDEPMDGAALAEPATIERLSMLATKAGELASRMTAELVTYEETKASLDKILNDQIPTIMKELGMTEFKMEDGRKVEVKSDVRTHIKEENQPKAYAWLEENEFDAIIKTLVTSEFGRGENAKAAEAIKALEEAGYSAAMKQSIHAATLKAFVKERLEAGDKIPHDLFGIFPFEVAKITEAKKAKKKR